MSLIPLDTPVLKVSRPVAACSRCRNAKIKCDGKLPACTSCEKNGRAAECTSTNDQFARGKERSYVSTLETRIDRLQAKLEEAQARKPSVVSVADDDTVTPSRRQSEQIQEPPTPNTSRKLKRREVSAIDDLVSDFGFLSVNATARDFYGFTTAMSYARLILSACTKDALPEGLSQELPMRHVATALIQHYLDTVFILLPLFDEASFYGSFENVYSQDVPKASPLDIWMVRMVLAISRASMSEQRGDQNYMEAVGHVCAALEYAEAVLHPGNISGVQALILLTQYAMLDPHSFDSWSLIGAVSRVMADLGLHQDPPKGAQMSRNKLEVRRRVFHCIYVLDRSTSLVQTRAFSFSDASASVKVPFHKPPSSAPTSPQPGASSQQNVFRAGHEHALDLINLRQIQSSWYSELFQSGRERWEEPYTYIWEKCDAMRKWFDNLSPSTPPSLRALFELELLYSYIYVLSPSPRVPQIGPFAQKLIFEYCIRYAELMLQLLTDPAYTAPATFYDAMRAYMAGRQFLDVLQHNTDLLLDGFIPPHPEVKPTAAPPPPMPVVPLPPGEAVRRFGTVRSINCIRNISRCLELLGVRFGYMSWNQSYQKGTATMLDQLHQRLRDLDEMNGMRKQSVWAGSIGSFSSSNGSVSYSTPPAQVVAQASNGYQHTPPKVPQSMSYGETTAAQQTSPQFYMAQPNMYPQQQYQVPHDPAYVPAHQQFTAQPQQQTFSFNEPVYQDATFNTAPHSQFGAWTGYTGPIVQDTLDEENAALRLTNVGNEFSSAMPQPSASSAASSSFEQPQTAMWSSAQQAMIIDPSQTAGVSTVPHFGGIHPTQAPGALVPQNAPVSMHEVALALLQSMQTSPIHHEPPQSLPPDLASIARARRNRNRPKGKGRARDEDPYAAMRQGSRLVKQCAPTNLETAEYKGPGFTYTPGLGYTCVACGRLCPYQKLAMHRTLPDGSGCVDMEVWEDPAAAAPERVIAEHLPPRVEDGEVDYVIRTGAAEGPVANDDPGDLGEVDLRPVVTNDSLYAANAAGASSITMFLGGFEGNADTLFDDNTHIAD